MQFKLQNFVNFFSQNPEIFMKICKFNFEIRAVQKCVYLLDLEKCCEMTIWWPKSALIQPRTSLGKSDLSWRAEGRFWATASAGSGAPCLLSREARGSAPAGSPVLDCIDRSIRIRNPQLQPKYVCGTTMRSAQLTVRAVLMHER